MGLRTESGCMSVTSVRYICHVVDACSNLHIDFHEYCVFNMSDQLLVGIVFGWF